MSIQERMCNFRPCYQAQSRASFCSRFLAQVGSIGMLGLMLLGGTVGARGTAIQSTQISPFGAVEQCGISPRCQFELPSREIQCEDEDGHALFEDSKKILGESRVLVSGKLVPSVLDEWEGHNPITFLIVSPSLLKVVQDRALTDPGIGCRNSWCSLIDSREVVMIKQRDTFYFVELMQFALDDFKQIDSRRPKKVDLKLSNVVCHDKSRQLQLEAARSRLLACPEGENLLKTIAEQGSFVIRCADDAEASGVAKTLTDKREILISTQHPNEISCALVMELSNLRRAAEFNEALNQCHLHPRTYAENIEEIEYRALQESNTILNKCIERGAIAPDSNPYTSLFDGTSEAGDFRTFGQFLKVQRRTGHTAFYEQS